MLSRDELEAVRRRHWDRERYAPRFGVQLPDDDIARLLAHIDALEAFRARVLAVARPFREAQQEVDTACNTAKDEWRCVIAIENLDIYRIRARDLLLAVA